MKHGGGGGVWGKVSSTKYIHFVLLPPMMGENPIQGPLEGMSAENQDLFGP
jgi:hypothetical protein